MRKLALLLLLLSPVAQAAPPCWWDDPCAAKVKMDANLAGVVVGWSYLDSNGVWNTLVRYGHWSEIGGQGNAPTAARDFANKSSAERAAQWDAATTSNDDYTDMRAMIDALSASLSIPHTTDTKAYQMVQQNNRFVAVVVGTVPLGTPCFQRGANGMRIIPRDKVTYTSTARPFVIEALCDG